MGRDGGGESIEGEGSTGPGVGGWQVRKVEAGERGSTRPHISDVEGTTAL